MSCLSILEKIKNSMEVVQTLLRTYGGVFDQSVNYKYATNLR